MPKKKKNLTGQMPCLFPPTLASISDHLIQAWFAMKEKYRNFLVLYQEQGFYFSFDEDASIIARCCGVTLIIEDRTFCYFPCEQFDSVLTTLVGKGYFVSVGKLSRSVDDNLFT